MTAQQQRGYKKLQKRIQEKEIVVMQTDKTDKLAVVSREMYEKMGEAHTKDDKVITWEDARRIQRLTNGHTSCWIKIGKMGETWKQVERIRETCINQSCCVAPMYQTLKDHKKLKPGEIHKTRAIVSSKSGMGVHLNNILSEFIEPLADSIEGKIEVISGEEMLNRIDRLNKLVEIQGEEGEATRDTEDLVDLTRAVLTGADAVGLYPSMKKRTTGKVIREEAIRSEVKWQNISWREAARYVAINCEPWEVFDMGLARVVPWRRFKMGCKPGVTGKEILG